MPYTVMIHIANEEPVVAEMEALPSGTETLITAQSPRMKDGKDLRYLAANVTTVIWPVSRVNFIEVMPSGEEEKVMGFVRE
jgi:hypothetical protein